MFAKFLTLPDWLQHAIGAAGIMAAFGGIWWALGWSHPAIVGAIAGICVFYGREHRDTETWDNNALHDKLEAHFVWRWRPDQLTDFIAPLVSNTALAIAIEALT